MSWLQFIGWDILVVALLGGAWFLAYLLYKGWEELWEKINKHNHPDHHQHGQQDGRDDSTHSSTKNLTQVKE